MSTSTMTIRLDRDVKEKLGRLAKGTRRSRSYLAAEAVTAFVDRELEVIEGIRRGIDDLGAGRVVSHEKAMAEIDALLDAKRQRKR